MIKKPRVGPKMLQACRLVRNNPGCTKKFIAEQITPCSKPYYNWALGYEPINRAIKAGLIDTYKGHGNAYALEITDTGHVLIREHEQRQ